MGEKNYSLIPNLPICGSDPFTVTLLIFWLKSLGEKFGMCHPAQPTLSVLTFRSWAVLHLGAGLSFQVSGETA